jgi:outer membrane protein OmpA-like peptidoglycan-associated protein
MKKIVQSVLTILLIFSTISSYSQFLLPNFGEPTKVTALNSYAEESMPLPTLNGNRLFFLRTYLEEMEPKNDGQDIWYADRDENGVWGTPINFLQEANKSISNAVIGASADANKVYVFKTVTNKRKIDQEITFTEKGEDGKWKDLEALQVPGLRLDDGYYSFYMNKTEDILMISMAPADTNAFEDLYVSLKMNDGNWSKIINLGSTINTPDYEVTPFLADDRKTLYFSSNGHEGLGESDIFVTYRLDSTWQNWSIPLNLGAPINSPDFDAYFVMGNNKEVYFTSNRGQDYSDIYYSKVNKGVKFVGDKQDLIVRGKFLYNGLPIDGVKISIYDENGILVDEAITDKYGMFSYLKLDGDQSYILKLEEEDFTKYPDAKIYYTDDEGVIFGRFVILEDGNYAERVKDIIYADNVTGVYKYKKMPTSGTQLVVYDENDYPIDTILTNDLGQFTYHRMSGDTKYYFKPINVSDEDYLLSEIVLLDQNNNEVLNAEKGKNNTFVFDPAELANYIKIKSSALAITLKEQIEKKTESKEKIIEKKVKNVDSGTVIYFGFNDIFLTVDDRKKLMEVVEDLKVDDQKVISATGHTDNVGSDAVNIRVGEQRANSVKRYIVAKGIEENRVEIKSKGEEFPIEDNDSKDGRAKNRRVVIEYK